MNTGFSRMQRLHNNAMASIADNTSPQQQLQAPLYAARFIDRAAAHKIDPLWPETFALWTFGAPTFALTAGGETIAELAPTDAGQPVDGDLSLRGYEALVDGHGHEDTGETSEAWVAEGMAAMRAAMPDGAMLTSPMRRDFRREVEARLRQVEAIGRGHLMSSERIAEVTGRPYTPRRSLIPPGAFAPRLAEQKAAREAAEARALEEAEAAAAEAARPKTLQELGAHGVEVRVVATARPPQALESLGVYWWADDRKSFFTVWERIEGLPLPVLDLEAFRILLDDETIPPGVVVKPARPTNDVYFFMRQLLEIEGKADTGPVDAFDGKIEEAADLLEREARFVYGVAPHESWRRGHLVEKLVRGLRISPDAVAAELGRRAAAMHLASQPPAFEVPSSAGRPGARPVPKPQTERFVPDRGAQGQVPTQDARWVETFRAPLQPMPANVWPQLAIETACVAAAKCGLVEPGSLRSDSTPKKTRKRAAAR